jgi:hypothetical protein
MPTAKARKQGCALALRGVARGARGSLRRGRAGWRLRMAPAIRVGGCRARLWLCARTRSALVGAVAGLCLDFSELPSLSAPERVHVASALVVRVFSVAEL